MGHIKTAHSIAVECKKNSRSFRSATAFCSQCTCELDYIGWNSRKFNLKAQHSLQDVSYNECHLEFDSYVGGDFPGLEIFTTIFFRNYPSLFQHFYSAIEPISWRYCKEITYRKKICERKTLNKRKYIFFLQTTPPYILYDIEFIVRHKVENPCKECKYIEIKDIIFSCNHMICG